MGKADAPARRASTLSMAVGNSRGMLPLMENMPNDFIDTDTVFDLSENKGAVAAHFFRIVLHYFQVRSNCLREVGFIDDEQIRLGDAGAAFARDFVTRRNVNDLDGVIGQFAAEAGGEVVATGFDQQDVRMKFLVEFFQREKV